MAADPLHDRGTSAARPRNPRFAPRTESHQHPEQRPHRASRVRCQHKQGRDFEDEGRTQAHSKAQKRNCCKDVVYRRGFEQMLLFARFYLTFPFFFSARTLICCASFVLSTSLCYFQQEAHQQTHQLFEVGRWIDHFSSRTFTVIFSCRFCSERQSISLDELQIPIVIFHYFSRFPPFFSSLASRS